jgi:hypothetical protein
MEIVQADFKGIYILNKSLKELVWHVLILMAVALENNLNI